MDFERTEDLKDDVLRLFEVLVQDHGYDGTTFQMMADILGITKGAITYHFKNKHHIVGYLIQELFDVARICIDSFPEDYQNQYWRACVTYILVYRTVLHNKKNEQLFFHRAQMMLWSSTKTTAVLTIYRTIAADFHKTFTEEELSANVYMDLGARHRLYEEYVSGNPLLTVEKFCYYHIYLMGCLSRLDEATIRENIRLAFAFADSHERPITKAFT